MSGVEIAAIITAVLSGLGGFLKVVLDGRAQGKENKRLQDQIGQQNRRIAKQENDIQRQQGQIENRDAEYQKLLVRFEETIRDLEAEREENADLKLMLTQRIADIDRLEEAYKVLRDQHMKIVDKNTVLEAQYNELKANNALMVKELKEVCAELEAVRKENEKLRKDLAVMQKKQTGGLEK